MRRRSSSSWSRRRASGAAAPTVVGGRSLDADGTRGLCQFGVMACSEERIRSATKKLQKSRGTATQGRLDAFFSIAPGSTVAPVKRKVRLAIKAVWTCVSICTKFIWVGPFCCMFTVSAGSQG